MTSVSQENTKSLQDSLVSCAISGRIHPKVEKQERKYRIEVFAGMTKVSRLPPKGRIPRVPAAQPAKRGNVYQFSRKSRKRMIEALAKKDQWSAGQFWTLTLPDEWWFAPGVDYEKFNAALLALFRRIERAFPDVGYIWRKEVMPRQTGKHIGKEVPHVHILIDGLQEDIGVIRHWLRQAWHEVLTSGKCDLPKRPRIDVQGIGSSRKAMFYVSKYTAKIEEESDDCEKIHKPERNVGRWWGVRGNWRKPVQITLVLTHEQYLKLRRYVRKFHKKHGRDRLARFLASWRFDGFMCFWGCGSPTNADDVWSSTIGRVIEDLLFTT